MSDTIPQNYLYVGSLITSVIGAALLIFADFAGWYWGSYYSGVQEYGWLDVSFDNLLVAPFLIIAAGLLLFCSYVSIMGLRDALESSILRFGIFASIGSIAIQLAVFGIFAIVVIIDNVEWWPDLGFFGGLIGAGLTITFLFLSQNQASR